MGGYRVLINTLGKGKLVAENCPFCDGLAILNHDRTSDNQVTSYVKCQECGARTREVIISEAYSSDDEALALWNTRYVPEDDENED